MKYLPGMIANTSPKHLRLHLLNDCGNIYQQVVFV